MGFDSAVKQNSFTFQPTIVDKYIIVDGKERNRENIWPNGPDFDLILDVEVQPMRTDKFTMKFSIFGDLEWEGEKAVGWGRTGWRIDRFMNQMGIELIKGGTFPAMSSTAPHIPDKALRHLWDKGHMIYMLRFVNKIGGKHNQPLYRLFNEMVVRTSEASYAEAEALLNRRFKERLNAGAYKAFDPTLITEWEEQQLREKAEQENAAALNNDEEELPF